MYFDGIRFAIEMIDTSYQRLVDGLERIASNDERAAAHAPIAMLDAWAVIDSANRLRVLLAETPGLKKKTPAIEVVRRSLEPSEALRNSVQHLPGSIAGHAHSGTPTWGSLSWHRIDSSEAGRGFIVVPGGLRALKNQARLKSPAGLMFHSNPDHVTLSAYGAEVDLSNTHRAVGEFTAGFERVLEEAFAQADEASERTGSDLVSVVAWRLVPGRK